MSRRLILKGALAEKKLKYSELSTQIDPLIREINALMMPASVIPLVELQATRALRKMTEIYRLRKRCLELKSDIDEIEKELGYHDLRDTI
ncbi:MAG: hypothetical protein LLG06_20465 [Desulfobacteraceae bacterium]|nr:hypothetical protein [Desulfobacteraceae bacterium]